MAGEITLTLIGALTGDPELRFTPAGHAVASFTIASNPRTFDKNANEWKDGDPTFIRCSAWRDMAENVAESLTKGSRVIASGFLKQRSYTTKEGENRTVLEMDVQDVGPSLKYAQATVRKLQRGSSNAGSNSGSNSTWSTPPSTQGRTQPALDEPPF